MWKLFLYSAIGAFVFFVSIPIGGTSPIALDHMVTYIEGLATPLLPTTRWR